MKKVVSAILVLISLASCYNTKPEPSFDMTMVLPADSMVILLADIHLADGIFDNIKEKKIQAGHLSSEYFEAVLRKHNINSNTYKESMRYYAYHAEKMDEIYEDIITLLSKKESLLITVKDTASQAAP
jgi:hypothetical protein